MAEVNPLFEMLNMIEGDKIPWNELPENLKAAYNPFIINRFVSSKQFYLPILSIITTLNLTPEEHYTLLCSFVSKQKHYFSYKKIYPKAKIVDELMVYSLMREYEISRKDVISYIDLLSETELKELCKKWKDVYDNFYK